MSPSFYSSESESKLHSFVSSEQLMMHVLVYAEILFRWKLLHKRIELLKAVDPFLRLPSDSSFNFDHSQLGTTLVFISFTGVHWPPPPVRYADSYGRVRTGVSVLCTRCGKPTDSHAQSACHTCGARLGMPRCSICRLPVKGPFGVRSPSYHSVLMANGPSFRPFLLLLGLSSH